MLSVKQLRFRYPKNSEETIKGINFSIAKGEVFGFLGPSGSGKSTTQKILYRLLPHYEGEVFFQGKTLSEWGRNLYEHIGVSFELPNHYLKLTAYENLKFFSSFYQKSPSKKRIHDLLEQIGLGNANNKFVADFSKGMKMRLNFVRAILHNPDVLFLDEPTAGLDPITAKVVKDMIIDLKDEGKTIFLTTHNMVDAEQLCNRVALLSQGEIKALDQPNTLKQHYGRSSVQISFEDRNKPPIEFPLKELGQNAEFLSAIKNPITTIHSLEASLEDVFIQVTGEKLQS